MLIIRDFRVPCFLAFVIVGRLPMAAVGIRVSTQGAEEDRCKLRAHHPAVARDYIYKYAMYLLSKDSKFETLIYQMKKSTVPK